MSDMTGGRGERKGRGAVRAKFSLVRFRAGFNKAARDLESANDSDDIYETDNAHAIIAFRDLSNESITTTEYTVKSEKSLIVLSRRDFASISQIVSSRDRIKLSRSLLRYNNSEK